MCAVCGDNVNIVGTGKGNGADQRTNSLCTWLLAKFTMQMNSIVFHIERTIDCDVDFAHYANEQNNKIVYCFKLYIVERAKPDTDTEKEKIKKNNGN